MQNARNNPSRSMQEAQRLAQAGDLTGAARICRDVAASSPNFHAFFMLGTIESHFGHFEEAEEQLRRAVEINPRSPEALTLYGNALLERGKPALAVKTLSKALSLQPQNAIALLYRGLAYAQTKEHEQALKDFDRVVLLDPGSVYALHNRAMALIALERHAQAQASVDTLLRIAPDYVPALANRALLLAHDHKHAEALFVLDRALKIDPNSADLLNARGQALSALNRHQEAMAAFQKSAAIESRPETFLNIANMLMELDRLEEAFDACGKAIAIQSDYAPALLTRANLLQHLGRPEAAFAAYDAAIAAKPNYPESYYHRGSALLLHGKFAQGWRDFEYRWQAADCGFTRPQLRARQWNGENPTGHSIVVYSEQGLGDAIQFARFLPRLVQAGAKLTFLCHPNLVRLFRPFAAEMEVIGSCAGDRDFDFQCALMSLPEHLAVTLSDLPGPSPYLFAEPALVNRWQEKIGALGFKVGIGWQGNPKGLIDKGRSVPLMKFRPLSMPGVRLISLQRTHGLDQLANFPAGMSIETLGAFDEGKDAFIDTAAIMQNLDLVITSDTATAHLAGALGRPCWVALKQMPDWRWMVERSDSPWYPSMRLFRQPSRGDWDSVFAAMADALRDLPEGRTP
jgi:tetratricopeptide (TPR) repeat protein